MFKVNNRNTKTRREICLKFTIKTPKRRRWHRSLVPKEAQRNGKDKEIQKCPITLFFTVKIELKLTFPRK